MNKRILWLILIASVLFSSAFLNSNARANSDIPPNGGGSPPPTPGASVYFSVEPVAVAPLVNVNASINGLEVPSSPFAIGQDFTVNIHLMNATATNVPLGIVGVFVDFDFSNILNYCTPTGFTTMVGQSGGVLTPGFLLYTLNGFYDVSGNAVDTASYAQATQYAVMAAITANDSWNNVDGLVAQITFQITGVPLGALSQSAFYSQLHIAFAELNYYNGNAEEIPYNVVQGTLKIDDPITIPGDLNNDGKVGLDDLVIFAKAYGSRPGDPNWNSNADIRGDGVVDLADLAILAKHYGQSAPVIEPIQSVAGYYLPLGSNISKIFVVSTNASYGFYPYATRTSPGSGLPVVTNGEPCVIINITLRNDYSSQYPPPNPNPQYPTLVYVILTATLFSGANQISTTDLLKVGLPPNAGAYTDLNSGENATLSLYLATNQTDITSFQIVPIFIGGIPPP